VTRSESGGAGGRAPRTLALLLLVAGASATRARVAAADPAPPKRPVAVERDTCDAVSLHDVGAILRVELFNRFVEGPPPGDAYRVAIDCAGDRIVIDVGAPGGASKSLRTTLAGTPGNVRSRVIALAVAELVRDLDGEPRPPLPAIPKEPRERDSVPPPAPGPDRANHAVALEAFAQTSSFKANGVWLAGGGVRFDYARRRFCAGLGGAVLTTTERFDLGTAQIFLSYGSPYVAWRETWGHTQTRLGAGYAVGAARVAGHATEPRAFAGTTIGPFSAPYAFAAFAVALSRDVRIEGRGEAGWVTSPVIGDVSTGAGVALEGLWASVEVGVALAL
jgi:hypothetical protein